jgi:hypothetical protein
MSSGQRISETVQSIGNIQNQVIVSARVADTIDGCKGISNALKHASVHQ